MPRSFAGSLRVTDRPSWERQVRAALEERSYREAGLLLGVGWRTVHRWAHELGTIRRGERDHAVLALPPPCLPPFRPADVAAGPSCAEPPAALQVEKP